MKFAIVLIGESFRRGGQNSRTRGLQESYNDQKAACLTHIDYINSIQKCGISSDVFIHTDSTNYDSELLCWYHPFLKNSIFQSRHVTCNIHSHIEFILPRVPLDVYDCILFLRIDLYLKPFFMELADPQKITQITFSSVCFLPHHLTAHGNPRISDTLMFVPKKYLNLLENNSLKLTHGAWDNALSLSVPISDLNVLLTTFHDSDSAKDWNPIYRIVNRPENKKWHSKDFIFNREMGREKSVDCSDEFYKRVLEITLTEKEK